MDYVYVCYKTDKQLALTERDLLVFRRLADLEKSFIEKNTPEHKALEEGRLYMNINFNIDQISCLLARQVGALKRFWN